jgi:hypothetical protein
MGLLLLWFISYDYSSQNLALIHTTRSAVIFSLVFHHPYLLENFGRW